jgi:hypothetical protein
VAEERFITLGFITLQEDRRSIVLPASRGTGDGNGSQKDDDDDT